MTHAEFEDAKDKILMGAERRTMAMTDDEKKLTAYHEAGHALIALKSRGARPHPQGDDHSAWPGAGHGVTLPEKDSYSFSREKAVAQLAMLFGGREAEIYKFGPEKVTSGASGDIQMATNLARSMVMEWGMSEKLGRVRYKSNDQEVFLGHSVTQSQHMSDETAKIIDEEVRKLIEDGETCRPQHDPRQSRSVRDHRPGACSNSRR